MDLNKLVSELTIADKICLYNTLYKDLACKGIDGDTELAHVNKQEMAVLRAMGGSGTINPNTNLVQFGGGGSPPPPPPATSTVTQQATIPEELKPFITDILEKSRAIQERREEEGYVPFQGPRLADFTEEQQTAFEGIQGLQGAGQPFYDRATALTEASAQAPTAQSVSDFSNPFIQNVIDIQKREAQRVGDVERQQIGAQAVEAGGFGGSRHAILEAEQARNLQQQLGDIQTRGSAAAFEDAQARLQQQRERERQAGTQFMGLGTQVPGQRLREITGLEAVGAQKQSLGQAGIDIAAQEFEIGRSFPERTLQDYQSIVRGYAQPIPASTLQRSASQQPAPSFLSQAAGLGAAGIGAFKAFGGNAQGGLVGLAEGGLPAGGTVLESQAEAISERAQNDPLTQVERQPLSQGQQFVRGQDNQEAATVEEQLKQIQGLALGATNAIAQGQQKLASMNTPPGMGAQPANFGGNVGSFGFKKGGLLALKHLANGGIVRLKNGSSVSQVEMLSNMSDTALQQAGGNTDFSISLVKKEQERRRNLIPLEYRIRDSLTKNLPMGGEREERRNTVAPGDAPHSIERGTYEPPSALSEDLSSAARAIKKGIGKVTDITDRPYQSFSESIGSHLSDLGTYLTGSPKEFKKGLEKSAASRDKVVQDLRYAAGQDRDDLVSDSFIKRGTTDTPLTGRMAGKSTDEETYAKMGERYERGELSPIEKEILERGRVKDIAAQVKEAMPTAFPEDEQQAGLNRPSADLGRVIEGPRTEREAAVLGAGPNPPDLRNDEIGVAETASITDTNNSGSVEAAATAAQHAKNDPKIVGKLQAAITNSGESATEGLYANLNQFLDDRKAQTLANKTELDKLNAEQRKNLTDSAANRDKEEGLLYLEAGLSILAQPGGQTALQAIAKGAKDSNLIKGLSKLNAEQKQLAMNLNTLDRKALKDKMGFDDREAGLIMKGAELDIKAKESTARMNAATNANTWKRESAISRRIKEQQKALGIIAGDPSTKDGDTRFTEFYLSVVEDRSQNMPDNIRKTLLGDLDFAVTNSDTWRQTNLLDNPVAQAAFKKEFFGLRDKDGNWTGPLDMERKIQKATYAAFKAAHQTYKQNEKK
jgi:hypothetical protein